MAFTLCGLLLLLASCGGSAPSGPDVLGVRLGMSRDAVHERLRESGVLEKQERKQQEVWRLNADPRYSHLIVAYNKEYSSVRFITAVAKDGGQRVRYSDVLDTSKASRAASGSGVTYTLENAGEGGRPGYTVRAIGGDPEFLKYYSLKLKDGGGEEEEEEEGERK